MPIGRISS